MTGNHAVDIDKHVRTYMIVFAALAVLTVVTVAVYYLELSVPMAITVALIIATVKGSLVACYFMHLVSEKKLIFLILLMTAAFFAFLLLTPMITSLADQNMG